MADWMFDLMKLRPLLDDGLVGHCWAAGCTYSSRNYERQKQMIKAREERVGCDSERTRSC